MSKRDRRPLCLKCASGRRLGKGLDRCRQCEDLRLAAWRAGHPTFLGLHAGSKARGRLLQAKYGISQGQYDAMGEAQGWTCAICRGGPRTERSRLHVDHDHGGTGRVRGLLCFVCNKIRVGRAKDQDADLYARVLEYLRSTFDGREIVVGVVGGVRV